MISFLKRVKTSLRFDPRTVFLGMRLRSPKNALGYIPYCHGSKLGVPMGTTDLFIIQSHLPAIFWVKDLDHSHPYNHIIISKINICIAVSCSINLQSSTSCPIPKQHLLRLHHRGDGEMGDRERLGVKMSRDWESWSEGNPEKRSPVDGAEIRACHQLVLM